MGFLNFLNKRSAGEGKSDRSLCLHNGRPVLKDSVTSLRSSKLSSISSSAAASLSRAQGHVDILDAQGGIRPLDFRSRVQAAGVRDYGEDVAERNMGENGVDVRSAAAREFYERKASRSTQSPATARRGGEVDQPSFGGSTYGGSEMDDVSFIENRTLKRPVSTAFSLDSRQDVSGSGLVAGRHVASPVPTALHHRRSVQVLPPTDRHRSGSTRSGISRDMNKPWISTERLVSGTGLNNTLMWQSRQSPSHSASRSISPPSVPRYRSQSSLSGRREEDVARIAGSQKGGENRGSGRAASAAGMLNSGGMLRANVSREDLGNPRLERLYSVDRDAEFDFGIAPTLHPRASASPRLVTAAPPLHHHPDWHNAVRRAVDETLAQLPLSVDWKALLEMTQNGLVLEEDVARKVPLRHSSLWRESFTTHSSSTPTTADFSDYSSSTAGYPGSRYTRATSTESLTRADPCPKAGPRDSAHSGAAAHDRGSAGDTDYRNSLTIAAVDEDNGLEYTKLSSGEVQYYSGVLMNNIEHPESPTSDYSEVDSFIGKRPQEVMKNEDAKNEHVRSEDVANEDEGSLFHDGSLSDLSAHLPGLVADTSPNNQCVICHVLSKLHGNSAPIGPCNHNGTMSRKQRLQALGYDYESDESDPGAAKPASASASTKSSKATKRLTLTSGSGGGLRRLKLVDDRIDEANEEERTGSRDSRRRQDLRKKLNVGGTGRAQSPCIAVHDDGNAVETE
ncbi:hypothetical protein E4U54_004032 [Claviceps lovelessii]|nr:hypothetical protein E4U54_004032 [Claviceps lovelessii]